MQQLQRYAWKPSRDKTQRHSPAAAMHKIQAQTGQDSYTNTERKINMTKWTDHEDELLRQLYPETPTKQLAHIFGRTTNAIRHHARSLKIRTLRRGGRGHNGRLWTEEEDSRLTKLYPTTSTKKIMEILSRSKDSVYHRATTLKLSKKRSRYIFTKDEAELAYLAGIIDGEGCIGVAKRRYVRLRVSNTNFDLIQWLYQKFGGSIWNVKVKGNRRAQKCWTLKAKKATDLLECVLPYLIIKEEQAQLALHWQKGISWPYKGGNQPLSDVEKERRSTLVQKMKVLNKRGKTI